MSFELKLALRYLFSKRRGLVRFTALVAVLGITVGVASLIIAQALAKGFSDEMRDKVLNNTAHITIFDEGKSRISNWEIVKDKIEEVGNVAVVNPTSYESAVISGEDDSSYAILRVENGSRGTENGKWKVESSQTKKHTQARYPHISLGNELAKKLKLKIGDKAELVTIGNGDVPDKIIVSIYDTFETGLFEYDSTWIYISKENYLSLKGIEKLSPKIFSVSVKDIFRVRETSERIRKMLGTNYRVLDWQEANKPLFAALSLERKVALAIISLIIFIAALNITTTLSLLVNERRLDIAVLRTCGAKAKSLILIFLFEGLFLSVIGIFSGVSIGLLICFIGNYFKLINISQEVYSLNYIPFRPDLFSVMQIILITLTLCLAAIIYPVLRVSKIKPLENFRLQ